VDRSFEKGQSGRGQKVDGRQSEIALRQPFHITAFVAVAVAMAVAMAAAVAVAEQRATPLNLAAREESSSPSNSRIAPRRPGLRYCSFLRHRPKRRPVIWPGKSILRASHITARIASGRGPTSNSTDRAVAEQFLSCSDSRIASRQPYLHVEQSSIAFTIIDVNQSNGSNRINII
jgi:hypothetical protein